MVRKKCKSCVYQQVIYIKKCIHDLKQFLALLEYLSYGISLDSIHLVLIQNFKKSTSWMYWVNTVLALSYKFLSRTSLDARHRNQVCKLLPTFLSLTNFNTRVKAIYLICTTKTYDHEYITTSNMRQQNSMARRRALLVITRGQAEPLSNILSIMGYNVYVISMESHLGVIHIRECFTLPFATFSAYC